MRIGTSMTSVDWLCDPWFKETALNITSVLGYDLNALKKEKTVDADKMEVYSITSHNLRRGLCIADLKEPLAETDEGDCFLMVNAKEDEDVLSYVDVSPLRNFALTTLKARRTKPDGVRVGFTVEAGESSKVDHWRWGRTKDSMEIIDFMGVMFIALSDRYFLTATMTANYKHPLTLPDPEELLVGVKGADLILAKQHASRIRKINARSKRALKEGLEFLDLV